MPMKVAYHTVSGQIKGQTTNGVRTHYLSDALGSVTTTLDDSGNVENTYRYKPYGALLTKIGSAADPKFLWLGSRGYRVQSSFADKTIGSRSYSTNTSVWISENAGFPIVARPWRAIGTRLPLLTQLLDPQFSTVLEFETLLFDPGDKSECGRGLWEIKWLLLPNPTEGAIVQEVKADYCLNDCSKFRYPAYFCTVGPLQPEGACVTETYWEAWLTIKAKDGSYYIQYNSDRFQQKSEQGCVSGTNKISGWAKFLDKADWQRIESEFFEGATTCLGGLLGAIHKPSGWDRNGALHRSFTTKIGCCCGEDRSVDCPPGQTFGTKNSKFPDK